MADKLFPTDFTEVTSTEATDFTPVFREWDDMYKIKTDNLKGADWADWTNGTNGTDWADWADGASIISWAFVWDDLVFTKDDASTVTLEDAKIDLKGDTWANGTDWIDWVDWNGIASITTNKVGKTTTVTITEDDSTVTTFDVKDGFDGTGAWDMLASTYDPTSVAGDAFDMDNMVAGTTNKLYTATIATRLANTSWTNTWDQDLSWLVTKATYNANTILAATTDNTPAALEVTEQTFVGRKTWWNIAALTASEARAILNVADWATANTKANWSELDTWTDDDKFATAKAIKDSHNVPSVAPWTSGNVLTSNGTDWTSAAPTGWSAWWSYVFAVAWTIWNTWTNVWPTHVSNWTKTITSVDVWYWTAWNGTLTVDVNKNGTTIFATTKPWITWTNQVSINSWTLTTTSLASGDILTIDIDAVPWTTLPVDLYVRVNYE